MFGFKKNTAVPAENPILKERDNLVSEVCRWRELMLAQVDVVLAQEKMTHLFIPNCPDDVATQDDLLTEQTKMRNLVGEYDAARANLIRWTKNHPEIPQGTFLDSHIAIRNHIRWKNKK